MSYQVTKSDAEWREELSPEEYAVLRKAGTERAFTGEYLLHQLDRADAGAGRPA